MGFYAFLEVKNHNAIPICDENHVNMGTPLEAFLSTYISLDSFDEETPEFRWFNKLENQSRINPRIISRITYGGDWSYTPNDYAQFKSDWQTEDVISEDEFRKTLKKSGPQSMKSSQ